MAAVIVLCAQTQTEGTTDELSEPPRVLQNIVCLQIALEILIVIGRMGVQRQRHRCTLLTHQATDEQQTRAVPS